MRDLAFAGAPWSRRELLAGLVGLSVPLVFRSSALALAADDIDSTSARILVVVELAGGNDGLNTVIPYASDAYYAARPNLAIPKHEVLRLDGEIGLHPIMRGLSSLWDGGRLAIVQGCGYPDPVRSHFESMEYWHTAVPHRPEPTGWVGRFADARWPAGAESSIVNISERQSLAVQSDRQAPIVFRDPQRFVRAGAPDQEAVYRSMLGWQSDGDSRNLAYLREISRTAEASSERVREATARYKTPVSYGSRSQAASLSVDLRNVAALIDAGFPTRIYYVSMSGFDTHAGQLQNQSPLLMYVADALEGFLQDLRRIGRARDVATMVFTEFGRRVAENRSGGTDHGTRDAHVRTGRVREGRSLWRVSEPGGARRERRSPDDGGLSPRLRNAD